MQEFLARPQLPCRACSATVLLRGPPRNLTSKTQKATVRGAVGSARGRFASVTLPPHAVRQVATKVGIRSPRLWEPGSANLYQVSAVASVGHREGSGWSAQIGVRSIRVNKSGRVL